uniref:Uncharacterized protein n=1 Tax=Panagrolaimus superbus TaxID=310955 RepID=A0A914YIS8_9BILA
MSVLNRPIQGGFEFIQIPNMPKTSSSNDFQVVDAVEVGSDDHQNGLFNGLKHSFNNFVNQFTGNLTTQKYPYSFEQSFVKFQNNI